MAKPKKKKSKLAGVKPPTPYDGMTSDARRAHNYTVEAPKLGGGAVQVNLGNGLVVVDVDISPGGVVIQRAIKNELESPLDMLLQAGVLDDVDPSVKARRFAAGNDIRRLFELSGQRPKTSASYERDPIRGSQNDPVPDNVSFARTKYRRIMKALTENEEKVVLSVCCLLEDMASRHARHLRSALDKLADELYGTEKSHASIRTPRSWSAPAKHVLIVVGGSARIPMQRLDNVVRRLSATVQIGELWTWDSEGVCEIAKEWAEQNRLAVSVFETDWDARNGMSKRNNRMLEAIPVDGEEKLAILVAFRGGPATEQIIQGAQERGIYVFEVEY